MTGVEMEIAAAASAADLGPSGGQPPVSIPEACPNCGARLAGRYCHDCGQSTDLRKRSILHLAWEAIEGMFHLDGRLARTLPLLFFRPGVLARDLIEGRLARHTPPFRTFLVALFLFILAAESAIDRPSTAEIKAAEAEIADTVGAGAPTAKFPGADVKAANPAPGLGEEMQAGLRKAAQNPEYFLTILFGWAHRLAFLLMPITAILLTLLYAGNRGIYVYDHILVASNLMSFALLTNAIGFILPSPVQSAWFLLLLFWTPLNILQTLRGAYRSGWPGAIFKSLVLWQGSVAAFGLLVVGLVVLTLTAL